LKEKRFIITKKQARLQYCRKKYDIIVDLRLMISSFQRILHFCTSYNFVGHNDYLKYENFSKIGQNYLQYNALAPGTSGSPNPVEFPFRIHASTVPVFTG